MSLTNKILFVPTLLLLSSVAVAGEEKDIEFITAQTLNIFCVQTSLDNSNFDQAIKQSIKTGFVEKSQFLDKDQLFNVGSADLGIFANIAGTIFVIAMGQRKSEGFTPFCSVTTEMTHVGGMDLVQNQFTTFKLNSTEVIGGDEIATYRGYLPGFSNDLAIGVRSSWGMTSISLFEFLP